MRTNPALKAGAGALAALAIGFGVSACGSSTAAGVVTAPGEGLTSPTLTTPVTTPTSGPLSKEPTYARSSAPAPTKLVVKTLVQGSGPTTTSGETLSLNFEGFIYSTGKPFSGGSTWTSSTAATPQSAVIGSQGSFVKGLSEGLVGVKVGSRVEVIIPPADAYGSEASSPLHADTLVFIVDVLKASAASSSTAGSAAGSAASGG